jgi:hypothetical protein
MCAFKLQSSKRETDMTTFTEQQIADVLAEMKRQARGKSSLTGISWGR